MVRKSLAPWSELVIEGIIDQPVDSNIDLEEKIRPEVNTGFIDQSGVWRGNLSSDRNFNISQIDNVIPNGSAILTPSTNADGTWPLDMTGFSNVIIAINPSEAGNYALKAVMGPQDVGGGFGGLTPVDAASTLLGIFQQDGVASTTLGTMFQDNAQALTADVWNIFWIQGRLADQKLLQFSITNNTGSEAATIQTAFMRIV